MKQHWLMIGAGALAAVLLGHEPVSAQKGGGGARGGGAPSGGARTGSPAGAPRTVSPGGAPSGVRPATPSGVRTVSPGGAPNVASGGVKYANPGVKTANPGGVIYGNAYRGTTYPQGGGYQGYNHNNSGPRVAIVIGGYPFGGGYFSPYRTYYGGGYGGGVYNTVAGFGSYYLPSFVPYQDDPGFVPPPPTPPTTAVANGYANIQVLLPDADGEVWFDGKKTRQVGTTRLFASPQLEPGKTYSYQVSAAWHQNGKLVGDERTVTIAPGTTTIVDFSRPAPEMKKE